jgi:hypothetical protein
MRTPIVVRVALSRAVAGVPRYVALHPITLSSFALSCISRGLLLSSLLRRATRALLRRPLPPAPRVTCRPAASVRRVVRFPPVLSCLVLSCCRRVACSFKLRLLCCTACSTATDCGSCAGIPGCGWCDSVRAQHPTPSAHCCNVSHCSMSCGVCAWHRRKCVPWVLPPVRPVALALALGSRQDKARRAAVRPNLLSFCLLPPAVLNPPALCV